MIALPALRLVGTPAEPPASMPEGVTWIEVSDAARLTGQTDRHLRRRCVREWLSRGLARIGKGASGRDTYFVRSDADPALTPQPQKFDVMQLPQAARTRLLAKEQVVLEWQRLQDRTDRGALEVVRKTFCNGALRMFGIKCAVRSLRNWEEAYEASGQEGLQDCRSRDSSTRQPQFPEYRHEVEVAYLEQGEKKVASCHRIATAVCRVHGYQVPGSIAVAKSHVALLNRTNLAKVIRLRKGDDVFVNTVCAYDERDYEHWILDGEIRDLYANDIWCGDHHICDTMCWAGRPGHDPDGLRNEHTGRFFRPWLTAWEDIRSRRLIGYYFSDCAPTSTNVMLALRHGIIRADYGAPRIVYIDNGKDFDCWHLQGMTKRQRRKHRVENYGDAEERQHVVGSFGLLGIRVIHATPYNAKAKPVERWFGTYEDQFGRLLPTYCGKDPQHKPERLERELFGPEPTHKRGATAAQKRLAEELRAGHAPTFDEYVAKASAWIDSCYNARHEHTGHGMYGRSPDAVYGATLVEKRAVHPDQLDVCLIKSSRLIKVERNGIYINGRTYGQGDPSLSALFGQQVFARYDPADISWVSVWTPDGNHLCDLDWNKRAMFGAMPEEKWNAAGRTRMRHNKNLREVTKREMRPIRDNAEIIIQDAIEQSRQENGGQDYTPPNPPAQSVKIVRTGVLPPVESKPLRKAVGAESMSQAPAIDWAQYADEDVAGADPAIDLFAEEEP